MTRHSGMTDREACRRVANTLSETLTAVAVEWGRKEVWQLARSHSCASEHQLCTGLTAGWPDLERFAAAQGVKEGTTWQVVVWRGVPKVLGTIA